MALPLFLGSLYYVRKPRLNSLGFLFWGIGVLEVSQNPILGKFLITTR